MDNNGKITKRLFIAKIQEKNVCNVEDATYIYESFMNVLTDCILEGREVILTGFGNFILKPHKGHKFCFSNDDKINDYITLKFSTSNVFNRNLRCVDPITIVKGTNNTESIQKE